MRRKKSKINSRESGKHVIGVFKSAILVVGKLALLGYRGVFAVVMDGIVEDIVRGVLALIDRAVDKGIAFCQSPYRE